MNRARDFDLLISRVVYRTGVASFAHNIVQNSRSLKKRKSLISKNLISRFARKSSRLSRLALSHSIDIDILSKLHH